ncbi:MAG: lanthionine synthetase LanC family protein [Planctomycetota bacterium]|nr:lanthionine synthetase LanC family protein [Planctomycetota bacterium]
MDSSDTKNSNAAIPPVVRTGRGPMGTSARAVVRALGLAAGLMVALGTFTCPAGADEYQDVAVEIGTYLVQSARKEGDGIFWRQYEGGPADTSEVNKQLPLSLYTGITGAGFFLLNLQAVTGTPRFLDAAKGVGLRLVKLAKPAPSGGLQWEGACEHKERITPDGARCGLYDGNAGIGIFLVHLHKAAGDQRFLKCANDAFERIIKEAKREKDGCCWEYSFQDIIGGEAGIGLSLLEMHRLTKRVEYLETAKKAGRWLVSRSENKNDLCQWQTYGALDPNFSHGAAGIVFFLMALREPEFQDAATGGARWIESVAKDDGRKGLFWEYYAGTPPEGKENSVMASWCHGSPGTARVFILANRLTGKTEPLEVARKAGTGLRNSVCIGSTDASFANPSFCCGAAGYIDAFCNVYEATGDRKFLDDAKTVADAVIKSLRKEGKLRLYALYDTEDMTAKKYPYYPTGFMVGNAGIGFSLLRLSALISGKQNKIILLPDHPFAGFNARAGKK